MSSLFGRISAVIELKVKVVSITIDKLRFAWFADGCCHPVMPHIINPFCSE